MLGGNVTANNSLASNIRLTQQLTRVPGSGQNQNDPCDESPLWSEELIKYVYVMNSESCVAELAGSHLGVSSSRFLCETNRIFV